MTDSTNDLIRLRRELHRRPEVGLRLPWTQSRILRALDGLGLEISLGHSTTSITAVLRGGAVRGADRPTVLIRSDMDALPVVEDSGLDFAATNGAMHACGHDLHMAILVGAAHRLAARRDDLPGDVVFVFQPGEENWGGALAMLAEGVLDASGRRADAALGLHVFSYDLPSGVFGMRRGPIMSASNTFTVRFDGKGGHGSAPQTARDPIVAAAEFVTALQVAVTRTFSMFESVVVTVGHIEGGHSGNVIPDTAHVSGTARAFTTQNSARLRRLVQRVADGIAATHDVTAAVELEEVAIPTVSTDTEADFAMCTARDLFGPEAVRLMDQPFTASEDFSWFLDKVPGAFVLLGACTPGQDPAAAPSNHSPCATFDDGVLEMGVEFETQWALGRLQALAITEPRSA
ncbi:M20 metallopeptidase family protein [Nocardia australiensis]|uniref:M20 metallopeptidase family protein n=1 Tax=Nocardia australiensis TaxID=2887191 RepID=UPI001D155D70|nr:M20 family metallopeptidase [Nocardia australiensis]